MKVTWYRMALLSTALLSGLLVACTSAPPVAQAPSDSTPADPAPTGEQSPAGPVDQDPSAKVATIAPDDPWGASAETLGGEIGQQFLLDLPQGGVEYAVWGTYTYTSDSAIGTAAVHAGLVTFERGGKVIVEVLDGKDYYFGSEQNGVTSGDYGTWSRSFTFLEGGMRLFPDSRNPIGWDTRGSIFAEGVVITVELPPGGEPSAIWGTETYTADSSIGTAAVHSGLVTFGSGGEVTIRRITGLDNYEGTTRNGVQSSGYGAWGSAFEFVQ
jgi:LCCL domain